MKSSTNVYGSASRDPAVFTETTPPKSLPSGGFAKDTVEVEGYVRGFARRRPDVAVCVLRFANILGPSADSPLASYFSLPVLPTVLGYDPRLQFVHEDDVIEVLRIASHEPERGTLNSGTFNIAGDGVLLLSQCARRLGRPTVPLLMPAVSWVGSMVRTLGFTDFSPEQLRLLTHGRIVSTNQMRETLGYRARYTTAETFADFARSRGPGLLPPRPSPGPSTGSPHCPCPHCPCPYRAVATPRRRAPTEERINDGGCQGHSVRRRPDARRRRAAPAAPPVCGEPAHGRERGRTRRS